jgi:outer membrane protein assembly factor BamB
MQTSRSKAPTPFLRGMALLVVMTGPAFAQPGPAEEELLARVVLSGESARTARQLAAADHLAEQRQWSEAIEEYQRVLAEAGDDLVPLDARHSLQARRLCHLRIAAMPADALRLYRARVDGPCKKWLEQGTADRDPGLLRRLVDEAFCSRFTDQALDQLGDLAFEHGDFENAERWWRMLAVPASEKDKPPRLKDELTYPDPHVDIARVRAKQILARLFRGDRAYRGELQAFANLHAKAQGRLAGRDGSYTTILEALAGQMDTLSAPPPTESWTTFAGDPTRNYQVPRVDGRLARLPHLDGPTWTVRLDTGALVGDKGDDGTPVKVQAPSTAARLLASYPLVVGNRVLVAGAESVTAYDLLTGRRVLHYDLAADSGEGEPSSSAKATPVLDVSYTLSATDERVLARLGAQSIGPVGKEGKAESYLVCLNLEPTVTGLKRWKTSARSADGAPAVFEGAPVVHDGRAYIAVTRVAGVQTQTAIACYDAESGALRWQRDVCATKEFKDNERRVRHHLLTLAGPNLVYCSHTGAIVALDAATGRHAWSVRYPSRGPKTSEGDAPPRSLAPCLYADGKVYAAPLDLDRILCLDALTGHSVWESAPLEVVHLLGAARGKLIFTTVTPRKSIRALDLANGNPLRTWCKPDDDIDLPAFGRGLVVGEYVFWPTRNGLHVLSVEDAELLFFDANIRGNLAAANGCLVVAGIKELSAYVPPGRLLEQRRQDAAERPSSAGRRFRLAEAEADAGLATQALKDFAQAESLAARDERYGGVKLRELARDRRHDLLLDVAEHARADKQWDRAVAVLGQAAAPEFSASARVRALNRQAALWLQAEQPERAVAAWQTILEDSVLRRGQLVARDGVPQPAPAVAAGCIDALIRTHGRSVYQSIEQRAQRLLDEAPAKKQKEVLGRLGREFPNALVTHRRIESPGQESKPARDITSQQVLPNLGLPLFRTWHIASTKQLTVSPPGMAPAVDDNPVVFALGERSVACHSTLTGLVAWEEPLPFRPSWVACHDQVVLVAGSDGIEGHHREDGALVWSWYPVHDAASPPLGDTPPRLGDFQLVNARLFFLQDGRRLFALDAEKGQVAWNLWAPAGRLYLPYPAGRFGRHFHADAKGLVIQSTAGKAIVVDTQTGQVRRQAETTKSPWTRPPLALDERLVVVASDHSRLLAIELATGKQLWDFALDAAVSLTGETPELLGTPDWLLVLIRHNYGSFLECLDPRTGKRRWPEPLFLGTKPAELEQGTIDDSAAYFMVDGMLCARALADGKLIWEKPLPASPARWRARRVQDYLLAFPGARESTCLRWTWLFHSLDLCITAPQGDYFPVLALDPKTGTLVQRLNFRAPAPRMVLHGNWHTGLSLVPQVYREGLAQQDPEPVLQVCGRGFALALGSEAWGLASEPR